MVIATGAYDVPNELGVPGEHLPHVSHYYREPHPYYRRRVVIVGGKNSAAEAALDLYRSGASVRSCIAMPALGESIKYWVKPDIENRIKEGAIRARFSTRVIEIRHHDVILRRPAANRSPTSRTRRRPGRRRAADDRLPVRHDAAADGGRGDR